MGLISRVSSRTYRKKSKKQIKMLRAASKITKIPIRSFTKAVLPDLKFDYAELEPHLSAEILELHHAKHHQTYINNYNMMSEQLGEAKEKGDEETIQKLASPIAFNYGGYVNHIIYWENMSPNGGGECPEGGLRDAIIKDFGSIENMQQQLSARSIGVQGSGWGWLGFDNKSDKLVIATTPNQNTLEGDHGFKPLIGIDVWEHAYYLQYKNVRPDYVKKFWDIIDWNDVMNKYEAAKSS